MVCLLEGTTEMKLFDNGYHTIDLKQKFEETKKMGLEHGYWYQEMEYKKLRNSRNKEHTNYLRKLERKVRNYTGTLEHQDPALTKENG